MKELVCFAIGLVVGALMVKKNHTVDELKKALEFERMRNSAPSKVEID